MNTCSEFIYKMNTYQEFIYKRTYSRFLPEKRRRETWDETVDRYKEFFFNRLIESDFITVLNRLDFDNAIESIRSLDVMPSMRSLWSAGKALEEDNIAGYNCSYTPVDSIKSFAEILYILMQGAGVGFSVERQYINQLPEVPKELTCNATLTGLPIVFEDSKVGWAEGYHEFVSWLYVGKIKRYDLSKIRPKGSRLRTFGGRASGSAPLKELLEFTKSTFLRAKGRKLNSLECYDIVCKIASCVVVGGVRRSATISLSNLSDMRMRDAKQGQFWIDNPQRTLSNNSVAYTERPDMTSFIKEWLALVESHSGERGIVNREALQKPAPDRRDAGFSFGVNPCGEIVLRPKQFCNLTEVVVRPTDTLECLCNKVKYATILGCLQSTLTDFKFLSDDWKKNCEEERLLGVSLTGLMDHPVLQAVNVNEYHSLVNPQGWLKIMQIEAIETAREWSKALGINMPAAITCVKPSGTVSQLVSSASGLHPRYSPYYIRRVRVTYTDPICKVLMSHNIPCKPEVGQTWEDVSTVVFDFPQKSPENSIFRNDRTAIEQLEYWKMLKVCWCEHNPSVTIYVKEHEWLEVGSWVYKHWDIIGGLSFLPYDGGTYQLAPYEEISEEKYEELLKDFPKEIDYSLLTRWEKDDDTQGSKEYACVSGTCEF